MYRKKSFAINLIHDLNAFRTVLVHFAWIAFDNDRIRLARARTELDQDGIWMANVAEKKPARGGRHKHIQQSTESRKCMEEPTR